MSEGMVSAICIKWREKEILLVPNIDPSKPLGFWGLPGGKMKNGETPEMAVLRELAEETGQEGITKHRAEIPKTGSNGDYIHHFIAVKISPGKELKNCGDPGVGKPKWISLQEVLTGRIKIFRGHIQGLFLVLDQIAEGKRQKQDKATKHGIPILSKGPPAVLEIIDEFKKSFNEKGQFNFPLRRNSA